MRGTLREAAPCRDDWGIIPAYAGNTHGIGCRASAGRDHPRVCGEHVFADSHIEDAAGSSPRMRGTLTAIHCAAELIGIIPAYAGNTFRLSRVVAWHGDHPRVCGEHDMQNAFIRPIQGSSPRMRGTLQHKSLHVEHEGIIPAYAGNTDGQDGRGKPNRDHPRVCGEHEVR